ncbi:unnamed protein product [Effrenium voratum]|nr:unnamed protein product [Effrenium voratum]CAJ1433285.1 unnamed protein product [Effrenium voratum]
MGQTCRRASSARQPLVGDRGDASKLFNCLGRIWQFFRPQLEAKNEWAVWVSVDPRNGQIAAYPKEVAVRLELALRQGLASVDLGASFFGATVALTGHASRFLQTTSRGSRDVVRVELRRRQDVVAVSVKQGRHRWSAVDPTDGGNIVERTAQVPEDAIRLDRLELAVPEVQTNAPLRDGDGEALWQWCQRLHVTPAQAEGLQESDWGIYSEEQNAEIEAAFQAGQSQLEITVGVRQYQIIFGPSPGFARQEDQRLRKRRLVRRLLVAPGEVQRLSQAEAPITAREQEECILCLQDFAETPHLPVIELPECKHVFHRACAQQLVDANGRCPCCRREVDWSFLG